MADPSKTPILDFTTLVEGTPIRIDGRLYRIKHPDQLPLRVTLELEALFPRMGPLLKRVTSLKRKDLQELSDGLEHLCGLILEAPRAVQRRLTTAHRVAILHAFIALRLKTRGAAGATTVNAPTARRSTGATSSRGSRASTAGRSRTGMTAFPSES